MTARRVLLIDSDPEFQQLLENQLGPHGFVVLTPPDPGNPLGQVKELGPAIIFIAVELPDKIGYALCNKAKKGPASHVPVVLVTSTVPASGFKSHRKLKVHADEYIDKRTMSEDEALRVVDQLVGLGGYPVQPVDDMDVEELDVDDLSISEVVEEADEPALEFSEADDEEATPEPVPEPPRPPMSSRPQTGGFEESAFGVDVEDLAEEIERAMDEVSGLHEMPHTLFASSSGLAEPAGGADDDVLSSARLHGRGETELPVDSTEFDADRTAVASPPHEQDSVPEPIETIPPPVMEAAEPLPPAPTPPGPQPPEPPIDEAESTIGDDLPAAPAFALDAGTASALGSGSDLDLGLEEVASQAEEEKSGVHERRFQVRVLQLEEEVARLKAQLDDARRQPAGGGAFSREREFLNLREVINKKEVEVLGLRETLAARDGEILAFRQTIRELRQERTGFDQKNVDLEREMLNMRERVDELDSERAHLAEQKATGDKLLGALRAELARMSEELGTERAARREEADALGREKARELDALRTELEDARSRGEAALEERYASDLRTLKEAYEETARERDAEVERRIEEERAAAESRREAALAEQARAHAEALAALEAEKATERAAAIAVVETQRDSDLADAERRREKDLAEADKRRVMELADAEQRRTADLAAAEEKRAAAENALVEKFEGERVALATEHREELGALDRRLAERDATLATHELTIRGLESDLEDVRESERGRVETIESLHRMLSDRDQRLSAHRAEIEELERVNRGYQEQILRAHQKIRADETTVDRAKKALAVALTLLDTDAGAGAAPRPEAGGNGR
jgi:CheY-like chemotaxis protein